MTAVPEVAAPTTGPHPTPRLHDASALTAVLCGTFRRDREGLIRAFHSLRQHSVLLSPISVDFLDPTAEFVRLPQEQSDSIRDVEQRHLTAIAAADFVWLHAPNGYVGSSATLELGHAQALGIPVFSDTAPIDATLAAFVTVVEGPEAAPGVLTAAPGTGLCALQKYYGRIAARRGWGDESAQDTLLLLIEELGELARTVRKRAGIARDGRGASEPVAEEIADVQLYLVHLANILGVDLAGAVTDKDAVNAARAAMRESAA